MSTPQNDGAALARAAADTLRRGDARAARDLFLQAAQAGQADVAVMLGLAYSCRSLQDWAGVGASVDRVLALDPRNLRALLMKGDSLEQTGDTRAASAYYRAALRSAPPADRLSPELLQELRRAQQASEQFARRYDEHMRGWLQQHGFDPSQSSGRVGESLGILLGRNRAYLQEPYHFYFPQLPQKQFYDRADFPWLDAIEAATDDIRAEWLAVAHDDAVHLWRNGELDEAIAAHCPKTLAALSSAPLGQVPGHAPSVLFSRLPPGARIAPRHGPTNTRLLVHLPLLAPARCRFRVGNDVREWQEGHAWVFDDSIEHEAWNESEQARVVLQFAIARPELSEDENRWVATLLSGIDAFPGRKSEWDA
jgi:hypothetical protein